MRASLPVVASLVAAILAGAALAVSVLHAGPRGLPGRQGATGSQGQPGKAASATQERFGICWSETTFTQDWSNGSSSTWVNGVSIDSAQIMSGVYQCPQGETFVSIVPAPVHS